MTRQILLWTPLQALWAALLLAVMPLASWAEDSRPRLAVLDFAVSGVDAQAGAAMAARVESALSSWGQFRLVSRSHVADMLREQNFQLSDMVGSQDRAAEFGRMLGAEWIVAGRILRDEMAGSVVVSASLINAQTGEALRAASIEESEPKRLAGRAQELAAALAGRKLPLPPDRRALAAAVLGILAVVALVGAAWAWRRNGTEPVQAAPAKTSSLGASPTLPEPPSILDGADYPDHYKSKSIALIHQDILISKEDVNLANQESPIDLRGSSSLNWNGPPIETLKGALEALGRRQPAFHTRLWTERAGTPGPSTRDIATVPRRHEAQYKIGEAIELRFKTDRDCYLTLINFGSSGAATLLFPNSFAREALMKAGQTLTIPQPEWGFELVQQGPPGEETVVALATEKPIEAFMVDFQKSEEAFAALKPQALARDIGVVRAKLFDPAKPASWSESRCRWKVLPQG
jgi:TolB-like protein